MILENCEIWFPKLVPDRPNRKFNPEKPTWEMQLRTTSPAQKKEWEAAGLPVKSVIPDDANEKPYFRANLLKRIVNKEGKANAPVSVVDTKLKPVDPATIGNGSVAHVRIFQYEFNKKTGGIGKAAVLMGIQLTKLVQYEAKPSDDFSSLPADTEVIAPDPEEGGEEPSLAPPVPTAPGGAVPNPDY